jgi:hypothetical protein
MVESGLIFVEKIVVRLRLISPFVHDEQLLLLLRVLPTCAQVELVPLPPYISFQFFWYRSVLHFLSDPGQIPPTLCLHHLGFSPLLICIGATVCRFVVLWVESRLFLWIRLWMRFVVIVTEDARHHACGHGGGA